MTRSVFSGLVLSCLASCLICVSAAGAADNGEASLPKPAAGSDWRSSVREFARQHIKHPAWGYSHSVRDYELAKVLAAEDHVTLDDDVLFAAAYLHDVAAIAPFERPSVDHADEAARIVDRLLKDTGFPMSKIDSVRAAIRTHMFDRKPAAPEAIYLHDADALDWLGAIGVARIFAVVDPNGGQPDGPAAVKMLQENLSKVPAGIVSKAGKARSGPMAAELQDFLRRLGAESADYRNL